MNIISKFKDYYDYLSGIWGVDPLLTYVRQGGFKDTFTYFNTSKVKVYIGGMLIEGFYHKGKFYYGTNVLQYAGNKPSYMFNKGGYIYTKLSEEYGNKDFDTDDIAYIDLKAIPDAIYHHSTRFVAILLRPIPDIEDVNEIESSPVCMKMFNSDVWKDFNLKDININSILPAEEAYKLISNWLSMQRTKAENKPNTQTNEQKIESHGFDKKTSFKPNIK